MRSKNHSTDTPLPKIWRREIDSRRMIAIVDDLEKNIDFSSKLSIRVQKTREVRYGPADSQRYSQRKIVFHLYTAVRYTSTVE